MDHLLHIPDSKNFSLPGPSTISPLSTRSRLARALTSYYKGRGAEVKIDKSADWPFHRFFTHEQNLRIVGGQYTNRINSVSPTRPAIFDAVRTLSKKPNDFVKQCASLYDCFLAHDILGMRSSILQIGSWDSHNDQGNKNSGILKLIETAFGSSGGLSALNTSLASVPGAQQNTVYVINSEFGRTIRANGKKGTDHGMGSSCLIAGNAVNGGVYGKMFPDSEIEPDPLYGNKIPLVDGRDVIKGLTNFQQVFGRISDWVQPGLGNSVFPDRLNANLDASNLESPGLLDDLLTS